MKSLIEINDATGSIGWDKYVKSHPNGTCFHLYGWREALEQGLGYQSQFFVATIGDDIVGVFAVACVKSLLFGTSVVSLPFCSYGGLLADSDEIAQVLEKAAADFSIARNAKYLETRVLSVLNSGETDSGSLYQTFRKSIPAGDADLSFLPSKRRNMVRKAIKFGLNASVESNLKSFYELYFENARAHGTPALPERFFTILVSSLGDAVDILFVKNLEGIAVSCIMSFYYNGVVHAGFAGELPIARELCANDFKYWSLYKHAKQRQCTVFDLGRSKIGSGSYEFKRLWGLSPQPIDHRYSLISAVTPPSNNPNNPKFALAIRVWPLIPRPITRWLGPKIIHGLG